MANAGVNKAQVKKARDLLVANGSHPSIDAVRIQLGNTGSKNTIHRYLKELNEESTNRPSNKVTLSDALTELVQSLATQLHNDAQQEIELAKVANQKTVESLQGKIASSDLALLRAKNQIELLESKLISSDQARLAANAESHTLLLKVERLTQELQDKADQMTTKDSHIASLEDKHHHARLALEHYRDSVKEQREQDQRRHETQVQQLQLEQRQLNQTISIKQTDITQLNKDNSQLTTELRELRKQLSAESRKVESLELHSKNNIEKLAASTQAVLNMDEILNENRLINIQLTEKERIMKLLEMDLVSTKTELNVKSQLLDLLSSQLTKTVN